VGEVLAQKNGLYERKCLCSDTAVLRDVEGTVPEAELGRKQASGRLHRWFLPIQSAHPRIACRTWSHAICNVGSRPHQREPIGASQLHATHVLERHRGKVHLSVFVSVCSQFSVDLLQLNN
jgi:hypothetical protein